MLRHDCVRAIALLNAVRAAPPTAGITMTTATPATRPSPLPAPTVRRLAALDESLLHGLADLLIDCVDGGASVSFMQPLPQADALTFWREVAAEVAAGRRALWVASDGGAVVGTVQLVLAQPPNQPHRADLAKMLVHRQSRRRGVGALLMAAAEQGARDAGKTLLVLDTASADAERLYARNGWQRCGTIPGYALLPDGTPCDTTYFYRQLSSDVRSTPATP